MESEQLGSGESTTRSSPVKLWIPPCGLAVLIFLFSSTPGTYYPKHPDILNNLVHLLEFGLLSFLLARALHYTYSLTSFGLFLWTTAVCVSFGLLDEAHQFLVPQRVFDLMDLFFDSLGAAVGTGAFIFHNIMKTGRPETGTPPTGEMDV